MQPLVLRAWVSRCLALIIGLKALDTITHAVEDMRYTSVRQAGIEKGLAVVTGLSVIVYAYLILTLLFRPIAIFPMPDSDSAPPASSSDRTKVLVCAVGAFFLINGLSIVVSRLWMKPSLHEWDGSYLVRLIEGSRPSFEAGVIQTALGALAVFIFSGALRKLVDVMFPKSPEQLVAEAAEHTSLPGT